MPLQRVIQLQSYPCCQLVQLMNLVLYVHSGHAPEVTEDFIGSVMNAFSDPGRERPILSIQERPCFLGRSLSHFMNINKGLTMIRFLGSVCTHPRPCD